MNYVVSLLAPPEPNREHYRLARHLHRHGPTPTADLAASLQMHPRAVRWLTSYPWFRITGAGWDLTPRGRRLATRQQSP